MDGPTRLFLRLIEKKKKSRLTPADIYYSWLLLVETSEEGHRFVSFLRCGESELFAAQVDISGENNL